MITIIVAFFSIIFLLVLHEFGHFITAKRFGIRVEEFGIGYPPRLFGRKFGETVYSLNLLPFGAFVKIPDVERVAEEGSSKVPILQRAMVLLGGVVSFWIIAIILLSVLFSIGAPQSISDEEEGNLINPKVQILAVSPDSPAEVAGLRAGDTIKQFSISGLQLPVDKIKEVQEFTEEHKGQEVIMTVERGKETFDVSLTPRISPPQGEGAMGVALVRTAEKSYPPFQAVVKGVQSTANLTVGVFVGWGQVLGNLISGHGIPKGVQFLGPIGIGNLINQAAQAGVNYFLQFIAVIAVYLAVFNILPIPALDGGKLLFLGIEKIKGRPINPRVEENVTAGVFVVLVGLMIWFTIQDISRLF